MATNAQRAKEKALKQKQLEDPDYVEPVKETDTRKLVEAAIKSIKKDSGVVFFRPKNEAKKLRDVLPFGIFGIDNYIIGSGGAPAGRIVEISGQPSGGKGTVTAQLIAETQRIDPSDQIAYVDAEHALDLPYAASLGVDPDNLLVAQPECGEDALQATVDIIATGGIKLVIVDSVAALVPRAELAGEMSDSHMGLQARMMGQALRKLTALTSQKGTCLVFINQVRCLDNDTSVLTSKGTVPVSSVSVGDKIQSPSGKMVSVLGKEDAGVVQGREIRAYYREPLLISNNHQQPVIDGIKGELVTKLGSDVARGDFLILPINDCEGVVSSSMPEGHAFFLGALFADGHIHIAKDKVDYRLEFSQINKERHELVKEPTRKFFADYLDNMTIRDRPRYSHVSVYGKAAITHLLSYEPGVIGDNKQVSPCILNGSKEDQREFLRGASFDTHGHTSNGFIWTFESRKQAYTVATMLNSFGIFADYRERKNAKCSNGFHLYITGGDAVIFRERIGFSEPTKIRKAAKFTNHTNARGKYDVVPYALANKWFAVIPTLGNSTGKLYQAINQALWRKLNVGRAVFLSYLEQQGMVDSVIAETVRNNRFVEITDVEHMEFPATDLQVEGELFVANGVVTHNSNLSVTFGNPNTTPGGKALPFFSSLRLSVDRISQIKEKEENVGNNTKIKAIKNKTSDPFKEMVLELRFGKGFDGPMSLADLAIKNNIWAKDGSNYMLTSTAEVIKGRNNLRDALRDNKELRKITEQATLEAMGKTPDYVKRAMRWLA